MKTIFSHANVTYSEYQYFVSLDDADRVFFLFDTYEATVVKTSGLDLSGFFDALKHSLTETPKYAEEPVIENFDYIENDKDVDRVDVMIDDENIMIESNSLKALRFVACKFMESGYILSRDLAIEKMFRKDKVTRYLRVFKIINQASDLCFN